MREYLGHGVWLRTGTDDIDLNYWGAVWEAYQHYRYFLSSDEAMRLAQEAVKAAGIRNTKEAEDAENLRLARIKDGL